MKRTRWFIGLDIAADSFTGAILSSPDQPGVTKTNIPTTFDGYASFIQWLTEQKISPTDAVVCLEATGVYGEALCHFLVSKGYRVAVQSPLKIQRAFTDAGHKNDTADSLKIAAYAARYFDTLTFWEPQDQITEQIQALLATRERFSHQLVANQNALKTLERKSIPTALANSLHQQTIRQLKDHLHTIDQELKRLIDQQPTFRQMVASLTTIPGVGLLLASHLLVITRGFTKPVTGRQLAAYLGICPFQHRSGKSIHKPDRSRRYGPATVRKLLYLAALSVRTHHIQFRKYFLRKVAEGKSKRLVLNNIENKLANIICAIINSRSVFIPNYRSVNPLLLKRA
jgi:transposase